MSIESARCRQTQRSPRPSARVGLFYEPSETKSSSRRDRQSRAENLPGPETALLLSVFSVISCEKWPENRPFLQPKTRQYRSAFHRTTSSKTACVANTNDQPDFPRDYALFGSKTTTITPTLRTFAVLRCIRTLSLRMFSHFSTTR